MVAFIPAGRKRTMEVLFKYFIKHSDIVDEVMLWENTKVPEDLEFIRKTAEQMPSLFKNYGLPNGYHFIDRPIQHNTRAFYRYTIDPNTIYMRFDDDIIYIDDDYFRNILDFRIKHKEYFLVFGNIVNNAFCAYRQQEAGVFDKKLFEIDSGYCMNMRTWGNPNFAIYIHKLLLQKIEYDRVDEFYFPEIVLDKERFSISNFCFFGSDFAKFDGNIPILDEEIFLTEVYPMQKDLKNIVVGNAVVSHYTFSPYQKPFIINTDILPAYKKIAEKKLSEDYYKLLELDQK